MSKKNNLGKALVSVAFATAAAAGAYILYQRKKVQDDKVKAEFSEKMKKWNELNEEDLTKAKSEEAKAMNVRPGRVYGIGKNALLGEDIIVNISSADKEIEFNPEEEAVPVDRFEELKKKGQEFAKAAAIRAKELSKEMGDKAQEYREAIEKKAEEIAKKAKESAEDLDEAAEDIKDDAVEVIQDKAEEVSDKAEEIKEDVSDKLENNNESDGKEVLDNIVEKAKDLGENLQDKVEDLKDKAEDAGLLEKAKNIGEALKDKFDDLKDKAEGSEILDKAKDFGENIEDKFEDLEEKAKGSGILGGAFKKLDEIKAKDIVEDLKDGKLDNKMESDGKEVVDDIVEKAQDKVEDVKDAAEVAAEEAKEGFKEFSDNIKWEDDESVLVQKGEELLNIAKEKLEVIKEKFGQVSDSINERIDEYKREKELPEEPEITYAEEYNVVIHNKGNKDYFFSPMLIQRYNSKKKQTIPTPYHEHGTTLEQKIIRPGETYTGKIVINKSADDDAIIMFEDMLMRNSIAIKLEEDLSDDFLDEKEVQFVDELLFNDVEKDE